MPSDLLNRTQGNTAISALQTTQAADWAALLGRIALALIFHNFWAVPPEQALNQTIHFMKNVAIMGSMLQVFAFGAGRYAVEPR